MEDGGSRIEDRGSRMEDRIGGSVSSAYMTHRRVLFTACWFLLATVTTGRAADLPKGVSQPLVLAPGPGNPRNSEGDFIRLKSGRLLFVYTHFTGGSGDAASAFLASRFSDDAGKTWSDKDEV